MTSQSSLCGKPNELNYSACGADPWLAPQLRLERRSTLLSFHSTTSTRSNTTAAAQYNSTSARLSNKIMIVSPPRIDSAGSLFLIRDSRQHLVAVCQQHASKSVTTTFSLFHHRSLSKGQKPSMIMGARILYKLGCVALRENEQSRTVVLWNGQSVRFETKHWGGDLNGDSALELHRANEQQMSCRGHKTASRCQFLVDKMLLLCIASILDVPSHRREWARSSTTRVHQQRHSPARTDKI